MPASKIGRFEIISEVAHSEHSSVYRATDTATNRPVALKAFNLDLAGDERPQLVQRLIQEAESTRNLAHQNIVLLYGAGEIDGRFCVATEYVEGFSVAGNIAKGERYTVWDLLDISRQVCNGLDHAHQHGVVHRRMHPANILVQWDGTVKILGFGIAGMWSEEDSPGVLSPASFYASPEQVRGEALHSRSNLFSWGAILYEMATGKKPFEGDDVETLRKHILESTPVSPSALNPKIPAALNALILKALSKVPTDRYATGRELLTALEGCKEAPKQAAVLKSGKAVAPPAPAPARVAAPATGSPFAAKLGGSAETSDDEDMILDASGEPTKAASAVAGAGGGVQARSGAATLDSANGSNGQRSQPAVRASTATAERESVAAAPAPPKVKFDPMMGGGEPVAGPGRSFSDAELPPMTTKYVDPIQPPPAPEEIAPEVQSSPAVTVFSGSSNSAKASEKKKFEMPQVDTKLLIYGLVGGLAIVLLVVVLVALYVKTHTSDDEGATPAPTVAAKPAETLAESPAQAATPQDQPAPETTAAAAQPDTPEPSQTYVPVVGPATKSKGRKGKEAKAAPVAIPGQLAVDSSPQGAQIQIDGRFDSNWVTPFTVAGLAPGQHNVTVAKAGFASETRALNVGSGVKSALSVHLNPLGAMISVTSDPSGASVFVDGRDSGRVTPAQLTLEKGTHAVLVRKPGYLEETTTTNLQPGQTLAFTPRLKQLGNTDEIKSVNKLKKMFGGKDAQTGMGSVAIRTNPKGAQIAVNQRILDHLSPAEFLLNPGNYVVDITASGYKPLRRVITVETNGKMALDETLEKE
jgi:hypothetical protein